VALEKVAERRRCSRTARCCRTVCALSVSAPAAGLPRAVLERMFGSYTKGVGRRRRTGPGRVQRHRRDFGAHRCQDQPRRTTSRSGCRPRGRTPRLLAEPWGVAARQRRDGDDRRRRALAGGAGEETLAALGYEPVGFDSSIAALQAFRAEPQRFDLVLTDETCRTGGGAGREIRRVRPDLPDRADERYSGASSRSRRAPRACGVLRKPWCARHRRSLGRACARTIHERVEHAEDIAGARSMYCGCAGSARSLPQPQNCTSMARS